MSERVRRAVILIAIVSLLLLVTAAPTLAISPLMQGDATGAKTLKEHPGWPVDFAWTLICGFLVMFMQAGFALVETGFARTKNVANVMMKNLIDYVIGSLAFWVMGYAIMMGANWPSDNLGIIGTTGWFLAGKAYDVSTMAIWFFELVFCATAATIVSGAIAERPKFSVYVIYSAVISAIIYPIYGHWLWGGGWLSSAPFMVKLGGGYGALDFAGSGVVHAIGGYIALAACIMLGPRIGKYDENGNPRPIPGHNIAYAVLGTFILWFGWFGFNPGSTLSAHELRIAVIAVNTNLAGAAAAATAMFITWVKNGKPDVGMTCNGALAGLVAITAPCAWVNSWAAVVIGIVAGFIVCYGYWFLENHGIDDMVGAVAVHGFNGTWGLISLGIFADGTYGVYTTAGPHVTGLLYGNPGFFLCQLISAAVNFAWAFGCGLILFWILKKTMGIRVSPEEEIIGLDITEHATVAYPNFVCTETGLPFSIRGGKE